MDLGRSATQSSDSAILPHCILPGGDEELGLIEIRGQISDGSDEYPNRELSMKEIISLSE